MLQFADALVGLFIPEDREGQSLVEYALIIAFIVVVILVTAIMLQSRFTHPPTPSRPIGITPTK